VADIRNTPSQGHSQTVNKITERLSLFLGGSYSADTLTRDNSKKPLHERLYARIAAVESRRQRNIEAIAQAAYESADEVASDPDKGQANEDWLARFIDLAQDVASAEMQQVWGHVLACEIAAPGSASVQMLDALTAMVAADLDLLEKVGRIRFPTGYLLKISGRNEFEEFGISEQQIAHLQSLGLVQDANDLSVTFYAPTKGITFDFKGADLIARHPTSQLFVLPAFRLTGIGNEIMPLVADLPVDMDYLKALGQDFKSRGYDYRIRDATGALIEFV